MTMKWPPARTLTVALVVALMSCRETVAPEAAAQSGPPRIPPSVSAERRTPTVRVIHAILPAVVNIQTEAMMRQRALDPWFGFFPREREFRTRSVGSGFVWARDGIIVTNAHVVEGASRIVVNFYDREQLPATVIGVDPDSDLAVLQVDARNLPTAPIGSSADLLIGEPVIAIGNPFGLSGTVTTGVVSATGRSVPAREEGRTYTDFIQTDASINPGNSGGPLVNIEGRVIGINTAIYAEAQGIGFAIPVDRARKVIEDLRQYGEVQPVWLGLVAATLTPEEAHRLGFSVGRGAIISRIFHDSPASRAGLRPGDVIIALGNAPIDSREAFNTLMATATPGQPVTLRVQREDRTLQLPIVPAEPPRELGLRILQDVAGVEVRERSGRLVISQIDRRSRGAAAGLEPGDVVVGVNGRPVRSLADLNSRVIEGSDRSSIVLSIARGRFVYTLSFPMGI